MTDKITEEALEVELEAGKKYSICTCGKSGKMPFCDNTHRKHNEENGTNYRSLKLFPRENIKLKIFSKTWKKD
tara:strand:+ start:1047 stop:1265 length:219 start_codon:yes stop_codon:yes gene_type:complete